MTLQEAIKHCYEEADKLGNCECGKNHLQLAHWLEKLNEIEQSPTEIRPKEETKNVRLFIAFSEKFEGGDDVDADNASSYIQNKFNLCFESIGYVSNDKDRILYRGNSFDDISQAIEKIRWSDIIIISNDLNKTRNDVLFNLIIDSGKSYLFEGQLDTVIHCNEIVEDCLNEAKKELLSAIRI
jgi:hypothetical protein